MKYNTPLSSFAAVERLFSVGAAILTAKQAFLTPGNFKWFVDFLKWKRMHIAQDDFDYLPSMSSK